MDYYSVKLSTLHIFKKQLTAQFNQTLQKLYASVNWIG